MTKWVFKAIKYLLIIGLITFLLEVITTYTPFQTYKFYTSWGFDTLYHWLDWILIGTATFILCQKIKQNTINVEETMRENRFYYEVRRWSNTPFISPLHYYYMLTPPQSINNDMYTRVYDKFYQKVTNAFRDRIFIDAHYSSLEPTSRTSFHKVVGVRFLMKIFALPTVVLLIVAYLLVQEPLQFWYQGVGRFSLPLVVFSLATIISYTRAYILHQSWERVEKELFDHFGEPEPRIAWTELFPHEDRGKIVMLAWNAEQERRARNEHMLKGLPVPAQPQPINNTSLAPYPYPSLEVPKWAQASKNRLYQTQEEWASMNQMNRIKAKKGNVVQFKKKGS